MQKGTIIALLIVAVIAVVVGIAKFPGGDVKSGTALIKDAADGKTLNLQITDFTVGTGPAVKLGDTVTVNYLGTLLANKANQLPKRDNVSEGIQGAS